MNVKMLGIVSGKSYAFILCITVFASCSKDVNTKPVALQYSNDQALLMEESSSALVSDSVLVKFFKAPFSSRGSRTDFRG